VISYQLLTEKIRTESMQFAFHLAPGDLLAFNNRRVLHGRTSFDETRVSRHLEGCYVDIDETMAIYDSLRNKI
jgi:gamma-butyrobetaine dioxygenase